VLNTYFQIKDFKKMRLKVILILSIFIIPVNVNSQYGFNIKRTFGETNHQIFSASYSSGGNYIVTTGSDNNIIIWNAESGIIYRTLTGLKKQPAVAVFSEIDQLLFSGGEDNNITIWDPALSKVIAVLEGHKAPVKTLDISPDGTYLASGSADQTIRIWDIKKRTLLFELKGHKNEVNSVRFNGDGTILASGGADKMLILWNISDGKILRSKEVHKSGIRDVVFPPDGNLIASCGDDNLIQISSVQDLSIVSTLRGHKDRVQTIAFTNDGNYLISGGNDQIIILWNVSSGKIISRSEKQGQTVLSVDIRPSGSDFISAGQLSENLEIWTLSDYNVLLALSSPSPASLSAPSKDMAGSKSIALEKNAEGRKMMEFAEDIPIASEKEASPGNSMIEIFSPAPLRGKIVNDKNSIFLIGRVTDPKGINAFLINKNLIKLSEAGVFQYNLSLDKGENPVEFLSVNNEGKISQMELIVDCTAGDVNALPQEKNDINKGINYALLIGINDYQSSEFADLDNPIKDAESLYEVLLTKYTFDKENMTFLKNPTQSDIIMTLDGLAKKLTEKDNLLIFYAGHGYWDEKGKIGYWFPSDASRNSTVNWFRNSTLRDFIGSIITKHTLLIADACFSGAIFKSRAAFTDAPQGIETLYELPSRKAMTSGILQEVPDESVFLKYLVKRLGENEEKYLTSELLFSSFKTAVMNNSSNVPQFGVIQNVGDEGGDFIFVKR
jgi:WD40 repeat protein